MWLNDVQQISKQLAFRVEMNFTGNRNTQKDWSQSKVKFSSKLLCVGCDAWWWLDNNNSIVTLVRDCAGSSATTIVTASQLGGKVAIARVKGYLHMRTLTPKKNEWKWGRLEVSPRSQRRGDKGEEESSRGMGKSPQTWIWKDGKRWEGWRGCIRRGRWCPWVHGGWRDFLQRLLWVWCK